VGRAAATGALAHYADPAYYDKTYAKRRTDVEYYVRLAKRARACRVLEYGVGSGRIALELARAGVEVYGVDLSRPMLERLAARLAAEPETVRGRVSVRHGDMRGVRLGKRFPLVIAPFNVVLHLYTRADVERFLSRVREHLAPGGRFVFDWSMPQADDLCLDPNRRYGAPPIRHPTTGQLVRYAERFDYDPLSQVLLIWMEFMPESGKPWQVPLAHRQFFPQEMCELLHYSGFRVRLTADFSSRPPKSSTDSLVATCTPLGRTGARRLLAEGAKRV
jgi:SAM-dependent methyltransferase